MNKAQIAETLRTEVGHLEVHIKKLQERCENLKKIVLNLEEEIAGPPVKSPVMEGKFRQIIDSVFREEPKSPKRGKN